VADEGPSDPTGEDRFDLEAAGWVVRRDAGLTPAEREDFAAWLAADPRHGERLARYERAWTEFDGLQRQAPAADSQADPKLLAAPGRTWPWVLPAALGAAAILAAAIFVGRPWWVESPAARPAPAYDRRVLEDGSVVELNHGAMIAVHFSGKERRVSLVCGEANFTVAKNPLRPFIVRAGDVELAAVGTAFDVRLAQDSQPTISSVEVLVTEGHVRVRTAASLQLAQLPILNAGQRAIVSLVPKVPTTRILNVSEDEIVRLLAWRPEMLDFASTPLSEVVAALNRRNRLQLVIADPGLGSLPIVASIRSDNVMGFVRLLKVTAGIRPERRGDDVVLLHRGP
jgi:transmembrane sensor